MRDKIIRLLSDVIDDRIDLIEYFTETDTIEGMGLDSIGLIKLIVMIEEEFHIEFDDEDILFDNFKTLKSIEEYIEKKKI